jgi:hypothetical protein
MTEQLTGIDPAHHGDGDRHASANPMDDNGSSHQLHQFNQLYDLKYVSATVEGDCRTTVSHIDANKSAVSGCNCCENSRADCRTNVQHIVKNIVQQESGSGEPSGNFG